MDSNPDWNRDTMNQNISLSHFQIPPGYERAVRFGANWTMIISPYMIIYFILFIVLDGAKSSENITTMLEFAGNSPFAYKAIVLLDGLFHALIFVTIVALFASLREAFPVRASLILVCGTWQMLMGFTKGLISSITFTQLGSAYITGDAALRAALIPAANVDYGLRMALQRMDSLGVMFVWMLISLLPQATNLPRSVRWLGWIMALGILAPDPGFLLVILLSPIWLFLLGRWMKRLTQLNPDTATSRVFSPIS